MKSTRSSFSAHRCRIKIEGFGIDKLISACTKKRIRIKDISFVSDLEVLISVSKEDVHNIKSIAKNTYRITVLSEEGYRYKSGLLAGKKALLAGIAVFLLIVYYQSMFISEVRVYGYEHLSESEVRSSLKKVGIYEGAKKFTDAEQFDDAELLLYQELAPLAFIDIRYRGNLAEITLAEGNRINRTVPDDRPCDIVAEKEGYIYEIIAKEGVSAVQEGQFVSAGQVLISGFVPIKYSLYGRMDEENAGTYVHATGTVTIKTPHRFTFFITPDMVLNTSGSDTLALARRAGETDYEFVKRAADKMIRRYIKENLQGKAYILNKDLNFSQKENIIEVQVRLEAQESIGTEQEIMNGI